jgi:hypothetical protein
MPSNQEKLKNQILLRSESKDWEAVKSEWDLTRVIKLGKEEAGKTCLCSHSPIKELCFLVNKKTGESALVGNCCVTKFLNKDTKVHFNTLKNITKSPEAPLNPRGINKLVEKNIISKEVGVTYKQSYYMMKYQRTELKKVHEENIKKANKIIKWKITGHDPIKKIVDELKQNLGSLLLTTEEVEFILRLPDNLETIPYHGKSRIKTLAQKMNISPE